MLLRITGLFKASLAQIRRSLVYFGGGQFGQAVLAADGVVFVILLVSGDDGVAGFEAHGLYSSSWSVASDDMALYMAGTFNWHSRM